MGRKKKFNGFTEQERQRIKEEVEERVRKERELEARQGRVDVIQDIIRTTLKKHRIERKLDFKFIMNLYKFLINNSDLSEAEKDHVEFLVAEDIIFIGTNGLPEDVDISQVINDLRNGLKTYREP